MKRSELKIFIICTILVMFGVALAWIAGRKGGNTESIRTEGTAMGTAISVVTYGGSSSVHDEIYRKLDELEKQYLSFRVKGSAIYDVNNNYVPGQAYELDEKLAGYIELALRIGDDSNGTFDITIRPLADVWGIEDGSTEVPADADIAEALKNVGYSHVTVSTEKGQNDNTYGVTIDRTGMMLDLGALGKGIACDELYEIISGSSVTGACVSVGGSILVYGKKPGNGSEDTEFKVGIKNPRVDDDDTENMCGILSIDSPEKPVYVSTSGDYEKYFIKDGRRYHHILNPKTGYPADTGIISATVVCDSGAVSDALSTVCILMGREDAMKVLKKYNAEAIMIDKDKQVYITDGLVDKFTIKDNNYKVVE